MDRTTYLRLRQERELNPTGGPCRDLCLACRRPRLTCLCGELRPFDPGVELVLLMHPKEARQQRTGTGRLAHLSLQGSRLYEGVDFGDHREVAPLVQDPSVYPAILFNGPRALNLTRNELTPETLQGRPLRIFVVDGTWAYAPQIFKRSRNLHDLPQLTFDPPFTSQFRIKRQPTAEALSTIEAIYCLLGELTRLGLVADDPRREGLLEVFRKLVECQIAYVEKSTGSRHLSRGYRKRGTGGPG